MFKPVKRLEGYVKELELNVKQLQFEVKEKDSNIGEMNYELISLNEDIPKFLPSFHQPRTRQGSQAKPLMPSLGREGGAPTRSASSLSLSWRGWPPPGLPRKAKPGEGEGREGGAPARPPSPVALLPLVLCVPPA